MKKLIFSFLLLLFVLLGTATAQNKAYIPDSGFRVLLAQRYPGCMVGDSLKTNFSGILSTTILRLSTASYKVKNLDGLQHFVNLDSLYITDSTTSASQSSNLKIIPYFPSSLRSLEIYVAPYLDSLPRIWHNLRILKFYRSYRSYKPNILYNLSLSLEYLELKGVRYDYSFITLPVNLKTFIYTDFYTDQANFNWGYLPNGLREFKIDGVFTPGLFTWYRANSKLPDSLRKLYLGNGNLELHKCFPIIPPNLIDLYCYTGYHTCLQNQPNPNIFFRKFNSNFSGPPYPVCDTVDNFGNCTKKVTSIDISASSELNATIYPNPSTGCFQFESTLQKSGPLELLIYQLNGAKVYTETVFAPSGQFQHELRTSLAAGTYSLRVTHAEGSWQSRILIVR